MKKAVGRDVAFGMGQWKITNHVLSRNFLFRQMFRQGSGKRLGKEFRQGFGEGFGLEYGQGFKQGSGRFCARKGFKEGLQQGFEIRFWQGLGKSLGKVQTWFRQEFR